MRLKEGRADLFLAYCTGAREALGQLPGASIIDLPLALATGADYGLTILKRGNRQAASLFAMFILSAEGQRILRQYGFDAPLP